MQRARKCPQKLPFPLGDQGPTKYMVLWSHRCSQHGWHLDRFSCSWQLSSTDRQTHTHTHSSHCIRSNRTHLMLCTVMQPNNLSRFYRPDTLFITQAKCNSKWKTKSTNLNQKKTPNGLIPSSWTNWHLRERMLHSLYASFLLPVPDFKHKQ